MTLEDIRILVIGIMGFYLGVSLYKLFIKPWLIEKNTKDIEVNPKWITPKIRSEYYGLYDVDIVLAQSTFGLLPRCRLSKDKKRLQLLIPEDTLTRDIDLVAQLALAAKIKITYGLWYPEKSAHWLSILCYLLDGGDIKESATKWEPK